MSKKHHNDIIQNVPDSIAIEDNTLSDETEGYVSTTNVSGNEIIPHNDVASCISSLCMKLECKYRCSQIALNELVDGLSNVIEMTDENNNNQIQQHLESF